MRILLALTALGLTGLSGCAVVTNDLDWPVAGVQPQRNFYGKPKAEVFTRLVAVLEGMDYSIVKTAPAAGVIEARSHLLEADASGHARQFLISARLRAVGDAETSVELLVQEIREGDFKGGATGSTPKTHGRYDSIYEGLEAALGPGSWLPPSGPAVK